MSKLFGYYIAHHRGDAPLTPPKLVGDAHDIEIVDYPGDYNICYLYCWWDDGTKNFSLWTHKPSLEAFLKAAGVEYVTGQRLWSHALAHQLLKGARVCPGAPYCTHREHQKL